MSVCVRAGSGRGRETVNVSSVALSAERNPCLIGPAQGSASVCVFVRKYLCSSGRLLSFRRPGSSCRGNTSNVKRAESRWRSSVPNDSSIQRRLGRGRNETSWMQNCQGAVVRLCVSVCVCLCLSV